MTIRLCGTYMLPIRDQREQEEAEANYFALCLLIPEERYKWVYNLTGGNYRIIADYFGVGKYTLKSGVDT